MKQYHVSSDCALYVNSSLGQLLKWKIGDDYIKTSTINKNYLVDSFMYESYAEVIASRVAERIGIEAVPYSLCELLIDDSIRTIGCVSREFKIDGYKEYSIGKLMLMNIIPKQYYGEMSGYKTLIDNMQVLGVDIQKYIDQMILFDSLILNDDRHYGNFGVMINADGDIRKLPLFDHGNSLFCHKYIEGMGYCSELVKCLKCKPFHIDFDTQLRLISQKVISSDRLGDVYQWVENTDLLETMVYYGLPRDRAKFIKELLLNRITIVDNYIKD